MEKTTSRILALLTVLLLLAAAVVPALTLPDALAEQLTTPTDLTTAAPSPTQAPTEVPKTGKRSGYAVIRSGAKIYTSRQRTSRVGTVTADSYIFIPNTTVNSLTYKVRFDTELSVGLDSCHTYYVLSEDVRWLSESECAEVEKQLERSNARETGGVLIPVIAFEYRNPPATPKVTATPELTATPTPTATPVPETATPAPTATPVPETVAPAPTEAPAEPTPTPTKTPVPILTPSPKPTAAPDATDVPAPTETPAPTVTPALATETPVPTATPGVATDTVLTTPAPTAAPAPTPELTPTPVPVTPSPAPTVTPGIATDTDLVTPTPAPDIATDTDLTPPAPTPGIATDTDLTPPEASLLTAQEMCARLDETHPDRQVSLWVTCSEPGYPNGATMTLFANVSGYDGLEYVVIWEVDRGDGMGYVNAGADGLMSLSFIIDDENASWLWRAGISMPCLEKETE